ncbi:MAG: hypothetical protein J5944_06270 [Lentisphaeria bacterium]|nr:hypothetical protein [Lentisphaeria bacterium]
MKKLLFAFCCLAAFGLMASEHAPTYKSWSPFQLGLFPGIPSYVNNSRVIGLKTGWPISSGLGSTVDGFEPSWIYSGTDRVNGLQASIFMDLSKYVKGFAPAGALNINTREFIGFQAACVMNLAGEITGLQAGALNIAKTLNGYQPGVIGSIASEANGLQSALFTVAKKLDGVQVALVNVCGEVESTFFQMGLVNVATKKYGIQLGLINVIKDGWVPFLPFFNICY